MDTDGGGGCVALKAFLAWLSPCLTFLCVATSITFDEFQNYFSTRCELSELM